MFKLSFFCLLAVVNMPSNAGTTIDCGRLLDVKSGKWREQVSVLVDNGLITSIMPMSAAPSHIDLRAYSCLPGLIDMHVHLTSETQKQADSARDSLSEIGRASCRERV